LNWCHCLLWNEFSLSALNFVILVGLLIETILCVNCFVNRLVNSTLTYDQCACPSPCMKVVYDKRLYSHFEIELLTSVIDDHRWSFYRSSSLSVQIVHLYLQFDKYAHRFTWFKQNVLAWCRVGVAVRVNIHLGVDQGRKFPILKRKRIVDDWGRRADTCKSCRLVETYKYAVCNSAANIPNTLQ